MEYETPVMPLDAFQEAKARINEIELPEKLKPVFSEMMDDFSNYFDSNPNLKLNVKEIFDKYLYNNLKIIDLDEKDSFVDGIKVAGFYNKQENTIGIKNSADVAGLKQSFAHEFIHFMVHNAYPKYLPVWADEMMTEIISGQVTGTEKYGYHNLVDFGKNCDTLVEPFMQIGSKENAMFFNGEFKEYLQRNGMSSNTNLTQVLEKFSINDGVLLEPEESVLPFKYCVEKSIDRSKEIDNVKYYNIDALYQLYFYYSKRTLYTSLACLFETVQYRYRKCNKITDRCYIYNFDKAFIRENFHIDDYTKLAYDKTKTISEVMCENGDMDKLEKILCTEKILQNNVYNSPTVKSNSKEFDVELAKLQVYYDLAPHRLKIAKTADGSVKLPRDLHFYRDTLNSIINSYNLPNGDSIEIRQENDVLARIKKIDNSVFELTVNSQFLAYCDNKNKVKIVELEKQSINLNDIQIDKNFILPIKEPVMERPQEVQQNVILTNQEFSSQSNMGMERGLRE